MFSNTGDLVPTKVEEPLSPAATPSKAEPVRVLVADDQADVREALRLLLKAEGYSIQAVSTPGAALEAVQTAEFDLMLMDLNYQRDTTSGREGMDLLSRIQSVDNRLPIVVMTAWEAWNLRWKPCGGAPLISSRNHGTIRAC